MMWFKKHVWLTSDFTIFVGILEWAGETGEELFQGELLRIWSIIYSVMNIRGVISHARHCARQWGYKAEKETLVLLLEDSTFWWERRRVNKQLAKLLFIIEGRNPGVVMLHAELHQGSIAGGQMLALLCFCSQFVTVPFLGEGECRGNG